ncbi:extracellular solute-binding protein [Pandoraea eparura]|jgi:peptide/nickel transport system substrate-binding protein|uniref:Extracellular solute-binding protein n=1 Tax=Pandoraea eparura TaxID=2508291 RepID=A0A5E4S5N1_9BURK|nr:ABC transporter substrate-binding protein [Pandoraea eparura]VVD70443.1 extracellular solute-binding protein [Pandoraea eparura]
MGNKKFDIDPQHSETSNRIVDDLGRGVTRRELMRILLASGMLASTAGGLLTHAGNAFAQTPKKGGKIRVAVSTGSTADTLDPAKGGNIIDYVRHFMFYNGLTTLDTKLAPQMSLAESFDTKDATLWTVKLRKDVRFHDGKPLTSADVVYSLMRHKNPATASKVKTVADQFEEIKATGPNELQIKLTAANADLPALLGTSNFLIIKDGATDFTTANGTGPYKCKEFRPGVRSIGVRNDNYWKPGKPYLDEIECFSIPDEAARVNALLSGDVQLINPVNPRSAPNFTADSRCTLFESKTGNYTDLIMRDNLGPVKNPNFVMAMKYMLDREAILKASMRGYGTIANDQPVQANNRYYLAGLPQRPFDLDKAKFHLQKSGMAGMTLPLIASTAATGSVEMAQILQLSAQKIGLNLDIKRMPADGYWSNHWAKHPLSYGNINPRPTVDLMFTLFFKSDSPTNESGWKNEKFDQLLVAARGETNEGKRKQMYGDMQTLVHEQGGVGIPIFNESLDGFSNKIKGYAAHPLGGLMGYMFADQIWLDA